MLIREAEVADISKMSDVRLSVKENVLNTPGAVTYGDYVDYLTRRGKGWVAEVEGHIVGFAVVDLRGRNIWALFVHPDFDRQGIGRALHNIMLAWYFSQTDEPVWLGTEPGTRAEAFYRKAGWREVGVRANGEVKFVMAAGKNK
ncbi:GNAT family N-acetyltransferase [Hymenobacter arizonensis]|uniref:Ribosomal protein S18 acetylase RimI n=1 Tax=Hymenobacter arizonensis TaxID=1227077 RepID=A0A1I5YS94_HYMAR|nr:GNAT family N-acetyltransferase [Hymenobacter arizonensis]SFQ47164.1 Ribosomal protein S18 acetylase RimI [Hymenobacter arizonensis]